MKYICGDRSEILLVIFRTNLGVYLRKLLLTGRTQYLLKNYPNSCKKRSFGKLCGKEDAPEIHKSLLTFEPFIWMILLIIFFPDICQHFLALFSDNPYTCFISKPLEFRKPELPFLTVKKNNLCTGNFWKFSASLPEESPPSLKAKDPQTVSY